MLVQSSQPEVLRQNIEVLNDVLLVFMFHPDTARARDLSASRRLRMRPPPCAATPVPQSHWEVSACAPCTFTPAAEGGAPAG